MPSPNGPPLMLLNILPPEVVHDIVDRCSMTSLLALRRTSAAFYDHASEILRKDRRNILSYYYPNTDRLWHCIEETHAVVGGFAALLFLMRMPQAPPTVLDIYVASLHGERLEQLLEEKLDLFLTKVAPDTNPRESHISRSATFTVSAGRYITVHTSSTISALDPIASTPVSALVNWVSPHAFACAYPSLTFTRRSLGAVPIGLLSPLLDIYRELGKLDFWVTPEPDTWPTYRQRTTQPSAAWQHACCRRWFVCPSQARYFGDPGSLLTFFDLKGTDTEALRQKHRPPYGISLIWRLATNRRPCNGPCVELDPLLPEELYTVPMVVVGHDFQLRVMYR